MNFGIPSDFVPIRNPHVPRIECNTPQKTPRPWRGSVRARNREKTDVSTQNCDNFQVVFLPHFRANFPPPECLPCAREDLPAIASAIATGSLGSDTLNIGFKLETADDFMPREEDFLSQCSEEYPSSKSPNLPDKCQRRPPGHCQCHCYRLSRQ